MAREYYSVRLPTELINGLKKEAKVRGMTVTRIIEERIALASMQNATLMLDFGGIRVPIKLASKDDLVGLIRNT